MNVLMPAAAPGQGPAPASAPASEWPGAVPRRRRLRRAAAGGGALVLLAICLVAALAALDGAGEVPAAEVAPPLPGAPPPEGLARLERRLAAERPRGVYMTIDVVDNRLRVVRGDEVLHDAPCSTGTGAVLEDPATGRRWVFDTPRGAHRVQVKLREPVWRKPDWAFIEEGLPVPTDSRQRFDSEALGAYGLYFGDGYLVHGTLYQRLVGRSVTHGCVRLADADLAAVYRLTPLGAPILIF
jgi:L,D-transpeptidase YbiS